MSYQRTNQRYWNNYFFNFFPFFLSFYHSGLYLYSDGRTIDCWFNRLITIIRNVEDWQLLIHVSNKSKGNRNNLSLKYDKLGVDSQHKGLGWVWIINKHYCNTSLEVFTIGLITKGYVNTPISWIVSLLEVFK